MIHAGFFILRTEKKHFTPICNLPLSISRFVRYNEIIYPTFFDPVITKIESGKPDIYRPGLFEDHLWQTGELVQYVILIRKQEKPSKTKLTKKAILV